jgi:hypothetical protein
MALINAPFGFRPAYHPSGLDRARAYTIANQYATSIYKGDPVYLVTASNSGTLQLQNATGASPTGDILGIFDGVEYTDAGTGKRVVSNFWPASQNCVVNLANPLVAWVWDDPLTVFEVQTDGTNNSAINQISPPIGGQVNCLTASVGTTVGSPPYSTGISQATVSGSSLVTSGSALQWTIVGVGRYLDNSMGDSANLYPVLQVRLNQSQMLAVKNAV